jgi:hypothetical protein
MLTVFAADSSTVPRFILVRPNMPVRGLGVDSTRRKCEGLWNRVSKSWKNSRKLGERAKLTFSQIWMYLWTKAGRCRL